MKKEELVKLREQAIALEKEPQISNFQKGYFSMLNTELDLGLKRCLDIMYESLYFGVNCNLQDTLLMFNAEFVEISKEHEFRQLKYYVFELYANALHRYKDECVDRVETSYIMNQLSFQGYDDICHFDFTPPYSYTSKSNTGYFRKSDLIKRLNEDNFEGCYSIVSNLDEEGNAISSTISFIIPINSYTKRKIK